MFAIESAAGDSDVDMRALFQLPAVSMQRTEDTDFGSPAGAPSGAWTGGAAEQVVEQGPIGVEEWPRLVRQGKGDVLSVAVRADVLLLGNPLHCGLDATIAAGFWFAVLAEKAGMGAVR